MKTAAEHGVKIFGGCCGTTPDYIRELKKALSETKPVKRTAEKRAGNMLAL